MYGELQIMLNVAANTAPRGASDDASPRSPLTGPTSLEIARSIPLRPVAEIAAGLGILDAELNPYGRHIAKIDGRQIWERVKDRPDGRYVSVTGITPTPLGEGK